jgi:serine/threonine-protein kinase
MPLRVEGASLGGRPVFFEIVPPWTPDWTDAQEGPSRLPRRMPPGRLVLYLLTIVVGGLLAWQNARRSRGDYRGARKLVVVVLFLGLLDWLLGERHVPSLSAEIALFYLWMARATLTAAIAWIAYFAVEPYVRRFWPQTLITWNRLLEGKFRDPLVGRDLLIGGLCGLLLVLVMQLDVLLPARFGSPPPLPKLPAALWDLGAELGLRYKLSILVTALMTSITLALVLPLVMLVVRAVIRLPWLAAVVSWLLLGALETFATGQDASFPWLTSLIVTGVALLLLVRLGLVALMATLFVCFLIMSSPITSDLQAWYAPASGFAVLLMVALLVYGFFTARAGQPVFWHRWLDS